MSSIEIRVDVGGVDGIPHTYIVVTNSNGESSDYGLGPHVSPGLFGPGRIRINENSEYQISSGSIDITEQQYQDLMEYINESIETPPDYAVPGEWFPGQNHNCSTWVAEAVSGTGVEFSGLSWSWNPYGQAILIGVHNFFTRALNWILPRDPLALDLDGDGIETLPANGTVLFDHDGDGTKNGTGWIAPDDGILVLDRNGNGLIDNGSELFGDNTIKLDGTRALDGFDALADIDSNGDGIIDTNDAVFSQLRIWRDANSDGISQASELHNLATVNIAGINIAHTVVNNNLGNGNVAFAEGTFTYANGTEGEIGAAASLGLAANNFYREFPDSIPIPESLAHLPDLAGSGAVRDLLEAA